jgi:acylphosphatase
MATVHLLVKGKVQGVFYRASAKETADKLGIAGWVRNTREGDVEIRACGNPGNIEAFIAWCKKGPPKAAVTGVIVTSMKEEKFTAFEIIRGE